MSRSRPARRRSAGPLIRAIESLESRALLSVQFVADFNTSPASGDPGSMYQANGVTFFTATDGPHGRELWRTDGTAAGTTMVYDAAPGPGDSSPLLLGTAGTDVFFQAGNGMIWRTDGSSQHTSPMNAWGSGASAQTSAALGNDFYMASWNSLFRIHDGLASWVTPIDIHSRIVRLRAAGSSVYLLTDSSELWISDGTASGTRLFRAVDAPVSPLTLHDIVAIGDTLYFTARNPQTSAYELWKTQGTEETTGLVSVISPAALPLSLTVAGESLFYWTRSTSEPVASLWKSDGTAAGTIQLASVPLYYTSDPLPTLFTVGPKVFFADRSGPGTSKVWVSDGTADGTHVVRNDIFLPWPRAGQTTMATGNGTLLFLGADAFTPGGFQLWTTDGTPTNTRQLALIPPTNDSTGPSILGAAGSQTLLALTDLEHGRELWTTRAGDTGMALLKDLNTSTGNTSSTRPVSVNGHLIIAPAYAPLKVVPTPSAPPQPLTVGVGGPQVGYARAVTRVGGQVFFVAGVDGLPNVQLCITDGTPQGTRIVEDLGQTMLPYQGFAVDDRFYFTNGPSGKQTLYVSDGTAEGTIALTTGYTVLNNALLRQREYAVFHGRLYFTMRSDASGDENLWVTDNTPEGTSLVAARPAPAQRQLNSLTVVNDRLYFLWGNDLYQTDGTAAGTVRLGDAKYTRIEPTDDGGLLLWEYSRSTILKLAPGGTIPVPLLEDFYSPTPHDSLRLGKWIYLTGTLAGASGIFRTDGTPQGTSKVADASQAEYLTRVGDLLYYAAASGDTGREVWATDGTPTGTRLVADLIAGPGSPLPADLTEVDGILYFTAIDGVHGRELWRAIDDVAPTAVASTFNYAANPRTLTVTFTENVGDSLALADWTLTNLTTGQDATALLTSLAFDPDTDVATLTLAASLPRGDYRLTLPAGAAADPAGNALAADASFDFFHLPGDANRDRAVNFSDLARLAQNYNGTGKTWAQGDFNGDGLVNFSDLAILAQNYNTSLTSPPPLAAAATVPAPVSATVTPARRKEPAVFNVSQPITQRPAAPPKPLTPARRPH